MYVIFGSKSGFITPFNAAALNGNNGFAISGMIFQDGITDCAVSGAGDVNGDGIADIILGDSSGQSYVIFGSDSGFTTSSNQTDLSGDAADVNEVGLGL